MFTIMKDKKGRTVLQRSKEVFGRTRLLTIADGEDFYFSQLLLKTSFRSEGFLSNDNVTRSYKEECFRRGIIDDGEEVYESLKTAKEKGYQHHQLLRLARSLLSCATKEDLVDALNHLGVPGFDEYLKNDLQTNPELVTPEVDHQALSLEVSTLQDKMTSCQQNVFSTFVELMERKEQAIFLVLGPGGTGKSFLIDVIQKYCQMNQIKTKLAASSANAARLIGGTTIHSLFALNPSLESNLDFGTARYVELKSSNLIIFDEISMMTAKLLKTVHDLCMKVSGNCALFGGKSILLFGDLYQLPPVIKKGSLDQPIYESPFFRLFKFFELTQNCRQKDDSEFSNSLNRIRIGELLTEDYHLLESRVCGVGHPFGDDCKPSPDLVTICSKRDLCNQVNMKELSNLPGEVIAIKAEDSFQLPPEVLSTLDQRDILPSTLYLKPNARIVLLRNIRIEEGLVNGLTGTVIECHPHFLRVHFDHIGENLINRFRQTISPPGFAPIVRRQFPVSLSWAMTAHKVQGMTLSKVRVFTEDFFEEGQAYVSFSRVRSKGNLHLVSFQKGCIRTSLRVKQVLRSLTKEN